MGAELPAFGKNQVYVRPAVNLEVGCVNGLSIVGGRQGVEECWECIMGEFEELQEFAGPP